MRKRIYEIINAANDQDTLSTIYDAFMIVVIVISLIPLNFKEETGVLFWMDKVCAGIFIIDYLLRWMTADFASDKEPILAFVCYPFTFMAIVDLLSILPSLTILNQGFKVMRLFRMFRALRVLRVAKVIRYSKNLQIIMNVIKKAKKPLAMVGILAIGYVYISALIIFNVEPDTFGTMFDAVYWPMVSLTTEGYGDIYPVSWIGRAIAMISSFFGIAVVALPAGIITAGYMKEIVDDNESEE